MADNIEKLPKTVKKTMYVHLDVGGWNAGHITVSDFDRTEHISDTIVVCTQDVTFKLPQNIDIKGEVIKVLEAEKAKITADTYMKLKEVQDKIDNLLAIEHQPSEDE